MFAGDPESDPETKANLITMCNLGSRIKQVRGDLSQTEFSQKNGITQVTLSRYERDERVPDADFIVNLCKLFNIMPEWLLMGAGPMRPGETMPTAQESAPASQAAPDAPQAVQESTYARCTKLEARLDEVERERRELTMENRQMTAENRHLWKENGELREKCARLEERQFQRNVGHGDNDAADSAG